MQVLLKHRVDPNQNTPLGENKLQVQLVGIAAGGKNSKILQILLDHGGNPNSRYTDEPALFAAIKGDHHDYMRLLLNRGTGINATNNYGKP
jgi:ankyrin repeat protein